MIVARIPVVKPDQVDAVILHCLKIVAAVRFAALREVGLSSPERPDLLAGDVAAEVDVGVVGGRWIVTLAESLVTRAFARQFFKTKKCFAADWSSGLNV